jgi:hypothetical protein
MVIHSPSEEWMTQTAILESHLYRPYPALPRTPHISARWNSNCRYLRIRSTLLGSYAKAV